MTQKQMPDPVALYEKAVKYTGKVLAGVKPGQLKDPTPCEKWNVQQLMEHISGGAGMAVTAFDAGQATAEDHDAAKGAATPAAYEKAAKRAIENMRKPAALDRMVKTPMGEMPGVQFAMTLAMDQLIHGWDLAKATKQNTTLPAEVVGPIYELFSPQFPNLQKSGVFKAPVSVPASASTQDKLLAGLGRKP